MDQARPHRLFGLILPMAAVASAMAAFQVGAAFAKSLFPAVGPEGAATLRLCLAVPVLLAVARPWRSWPRRAPIPPLIILGLSTAGGIQFFYLAIDHLPQGEAVALQFLGPLTVAIASSRRWSDLIWVVLAAAGVWLLLGASAAGAKFDLVGIIFALAAACSWACYIVVGRAATTAFGSSTPALALSIAALALLPLGLHRAGLALFSPAILPMAFFVAMLAAAIPFSLEMFALPRIPRRTFAVFTSVEPAFGALSGVLLLHEHMALAQLCGVAAVITAAAGSAWSSAASSETTGATEAPQV